MIEIPGRIQNLINTIKKNNPLQSSFLDNSVSRLNLQEVDDFMAYLEFCLAGDQDIDYLARAYNRFIKDTIREQLFFKKHHCYRYSSYEEVASSVYLNDDYMEMYMQALALTSFLWPNHRAMHQFFLSTLPRDVGGTYLEIGPGHGFYFMNAMRLTAYNHFEGIDISPKSVELTRNILGSSFFGKFENYRITYQDFLSAQTTAPFYEAVVMGEVLEHVENPLAFLLKIKELTTADSYIYITTCVNSPEIDHIYLFRQIEAIETLVELAGLSVKNKLAFPYVGFTLDEAVREQLPINLALELTHKNE